MTSTILPRAWPTVVHMLDHAARHSPDLPALACGTEHLNYREYAACVAGLAAELGQSGIGPGDRVLLFMGNSIDIAIATFAVQAAGAQVVPLNPAYTQSELRQIAADAKAVGIIFDEGAQAVVQEACAECRLRLAVGAGSGARRLDVWRKQPELADSLPLPDPDWPSTLQYTGGTTGLPKGVSLAHRAVAINVSQREALLPTEIGRERILAITPLFHVYAVSMGLYLAAYAQSELVIVARYRPETVLDEIQARHITLMSGSPTIFMGLMGYEGFAKADLSSLRLCFSGSAALAEETLRKWEHATGCIICEGYGQTEAGPVLTYNPSQGVRKIGSVGIPVPDTEIQIVDVETGESVLGEGEMGEIRARGPQIMTEYFGMGEETARTLRDGWLYTGDIGRIDEDGYLTICDRKKEMVIVSGFNVYPREIEECLFRHKGVREAAVVGIPDAYRGEALVAYVVAADPGLSEEAIAAYLAEHLVKYKWPSHIRLVESLPRTTVGKIEKKRLREQARQEHANAEGDHHG